MSECPNCRTFSAQLAAARDDLIPPVPRAVVIQKLVERCEAAESALAEAQRERDALREHGWKCPACSAVNAPLVKQCACRGNRTLRERITTP